MSIVNLIYLRTSVYASLRDSSDGLAHTLPMAEGCTVRYLYFSVYTS